MLTVSLADSVRTLASGETTFVKPLEERMSIATFLSKLTTPSDEALYLQSQDGNIYRAQPGLREEPELASFQQVVERDVAWMRDAMGMSSMLGSTAIPPSGRPQTFNGSG